MVKYYIANTVWSFVREPAPECEVAELYAKIKASGNRFHDYVGVLIVTGQNYSQQLLDEGRFLSLQGQYDWIASPSTAGQQWSGMELLLGAEHHQKIYCHGIFVANCISYDGFGLNYTGMS